MKLLIFLIIATPLAAVQQTPFLLEAGEFRWFPVNVRQIPTEFACKFQVVTGGPTVHLELLRMRDFRLFNLNREHDALGVSPKSSHGELRGTAESHGQYAVVVVNDKSAPPATVSLEVSTELVMSRELPPARRLAVILVSFAMFFAIVTWSGLKLLRAARAS